LPDFAVFEEDCVSCLLRPFGVGGVPTGLPSTSIKQRSKRIFPVTSTSLKSRDFFKRCQERELPRFNSISSRSSVTCPRNCLHRLSSIETRRRPSAPRGLTGNNISDFHLGAFVAVGVEITRVSSS